MGGLEQALRGAAAPAAAARAPRTLVVAGAGGALGAAIVEQALGAGVFARVAALVERALRAAPQRLVGVAPNALAALGADTAVIVFDRARGRHGREDVFVQPAPETLPTLAAAVRAAGVRRLVVVLPHAPALLPQAFKLGLASLDEQAVAAMGFEQLVFVRSAQSAGDGDAALHGLQRVAAALLAQLRWMVPQREQPVRAEQVARVVLAIAEALPDAAPATRVAPPELVWQAAQPGATREQVARWLAGGSVDAVPLPRQRW